MHARPLQMCVMPMVQQAAEMEEMLMEHEDCDAVRPGFVRINFPYYWTFERVQFVINAVQFVAKVRRSLRSMRGGFLITS